MQNFGSKVSGIEFLNILMLQTECTIRVPCEVHF